MWSGEGEMRTLISNTVCRLLEDQVQVGSTGDEMRAPHGEEDTGAALGHDS